jgi:hypothetical protein
MPLRPGSDRDAISENIRRLRAEGYPEKQAVAIALDTARRSGAKRPPPSGRRRPSLNAVAKRLARR